MLEVQVGGSGHGEPLKGVLLGIPSPLISLVCLLYDTLAHIWCTRGLLVVALISWRHPTFPSWATFSLTDYYEITRGTNTDFAPLLPFLPS